MSEYLKALPRYLDYQHAVGGAGPIKGLFDAANPRLPLKDAIAVMAPFLGSDLAAELFTSNQHVRRDAVQALIKAHGMDDDLARAIYLYTVECELYPKLNEVPPFTGSHEKGF